MDVIEEEMGEGVVEVKTPEQKVPSFAPICNSDSFFTFSDCSERTIK